MGYFLYFRNAWKSLERSVRGELNQLGRLLFLCPVINSGQGFHSSPIAIQLSKRLRASPYPMEIVVLDSVSPTRIGLDWVKRYVVTELTVRVFL